MTDTTKWTEKAVESLIGFDPMTNKHHCKHCGNLYKHPGTCANHIRKEHPERVQMKLNEMAEEQDMAKITYYHKLLFTETNRKLRNTRKAVNEAKEKLDKDFAYAFSWVTEELLMNIETMSLLMQVKKTIEHFDNLDDIVQGLEDLKVALTKDVIGRFPHHNSTSELDNIHERLKVEAKAKFIGGIFGGSHLGEMIHIATDLKELVDKL